MWTFRSSGPEVSISWGIQPGDCFFFSSFKQFCWRKKTEIFHLNNLQSPWSLGRYIFLSCMHKIKICEVQYNVFSGSRDNNLCDQENYLCTKARKKKEKEIPLLGISEPLDYPQRCKLFLSCVYVLIHGPNNLKLEVAGWKLFTLCSHLLATSLSFHFLLLLKNKCKVVT